MLVEFITPIVKVWKEGKKSDDRQHETSFFTLQEYQAWKERTDGGRGWKSKYYKGLGTSTAKEAKEYFREIENHEIKFRWNSDQDGEAIDLAFNKKRADDRKAGSGPLLKVAIEGTEEKLQQKLQLSRQCLCLPCQARFMTLSHSCAKRWRDLEVVLPVYFRAWDAAGRAAEDAQNGDWAKVASALLKYIHTHHSRFQNERETLSRADRLTLFSEVEAPIELELKGRLSLLTAFQWHMVSARRQGEYFRSLIDKLAQEHYLMAYDFRQKLRLPLAPTETGPMWHCQQKVSLACWGGVFVKHSTKSTVAQPQVDLTFLLFLSEVVEQPAEASNLMLQEALNATGAPFSGTLQLWSDTGPHFRSAGNLFFYARKLCQARKQPIQIRWLAEQHGKSILDEMFAWTGTHRDGWLGKHAARFPIYNIDDMAQALKTGAAAQMQKDPSGPKWIVKKVRYPERRASVRQFLHAPSLKITGTYALDAEPHHGQAPVPPALVNRIFADSDDRCRVLDWKLETLTEDAPETWRKTFFDGPKPWEEEVDWRADHHLKRVYEAQRNRPPPRQILPTKTL
ncbi:unnamed protein product [Effrenium voratum]|nr:unnamed protein product [Effrenium voratum]